MAEGHPGPNMIGGYGPWAASIVGDAPPEFSFRNSDWQDLEKWKPRALDRLMDRLGMPGIAESPQVVVDSRYTFEGLEVEELSWHLPYGAPTKAYFLKVEGAKGPLPGILALHDHGGRNTSVGGRSAELLETGIR